jgi:heme/copper-type cytochrome/quinol oxidase subunit 2
MMTKSRNKLDFIILFLLIAILAGLPLGLRAYDRKVWQEKIPAGAKVFTLTGNAERGWISGDVHAFEVLSTSRHDLIAERPVITASKGDLVVFRLRSSDVIHGFSLKDFGVFITDGIQPGKSTLVSFVADKTGTFTFSCNAICGDMHEKMQGTLIVRA